MVEELITSIHNFDEKGKEISERRVDNGCS
jgi:hypothetical protein